MKSRFAQGFRNHPLRGRFQDWNKAPWWPRIYRATRNVLALIYGLHESYLGDRPGLSANASWQVFGNA